jgi:hypothetical protein
MSYNKNSKNYNFTQRRHYTPHSGRKEKYQYAKFLKRKRGSLSKKSINHNYGKHKESVQKHDNELQKFLIEKRKESENVVDAIKDGYGVSEEPDREQDQNVHPPRFSRLYLQKIEKEKKNNPYHPLHGLPDISSPDPNDINQGINNLVGNPFVQNWASDRFGPMMNPNPYGPRPNTRQPFVPRKPLPDEDGEHYFDGGARRTKRRKRRKCRKNRRTKCRRTKSRKKRTRRNKYKKHTKTKRGCRKSN